MEKDDILEIFYNEIVREAKGGRVDCYFFYNLIFNTVYEDKYISASSEVDNLLIPTLNIKDKDKFDELLVTYVRKALEFYDDNNFHKDAIDEGISREKIIMTLLWSNACWEDYQDPCNYLRKRINFFDDSSFKNFVSGRIILGNSENLLGSDISCKVEKCKLENETPYSLNICLSKEVCEKLEIYQLPRIYFGIDGEVVYLYAIQNDRGIDNDKSSYVKKINRAMYKVNQGFDASRDNFDIYGVGNLKDVTPSFLLVSNIALGLFKSMGFSKVVVSSLLVTRWNSKRISNDFKEKKGILIKELNQDDIQRNLSDKFIRTFLRLVYHHSGIENINDVSYDSSGLMLEILDSDRCDNLLLDETYNLSGNLNKGKGR